jgi:ABC-2 type transport system permease protein
VINVRATRLVAEREIREQMRGRTLWVSTALSVVALALLVILPKVLAGGPPTYRIGVVGEASVAMQSTISDAAKSAGAHARLVPLSDRATAVARLRVKGADHIDIAVVVSGSGSVIVDRELVPGETTRHALTAQALAQAVSTAKAVESSGLSPQVASALTNAHPLPIDHVRPVPASNAKRGVALAGAIVFYILVLRYGFGLLMGVVQEKSTRVIEVILSAVRPIDLLSGKVLGSALIVLTQGVLLVATVVISAAAVGSNVLKQTGVGVLVVAFVWVLLGFFLYAAVFTAAGSLASKSEDAQSVGLPVQIPLFVGYFSAFTALGSGTPSGLVRVLAYIPFTAPMDMPVLAATGGAGLVQVVISMLITSVAIVVTMRLATVIFSRSILRTGRRLKARQILREGPGPASVAR